MIAPLRADDDGRDDGEARKRAALDAHETRRAAVVLRGRRALLIAALARGWATADDVRAAVELPARRAARMPRRGPWAAGASGHHRRGRDGHDGAIHSPRSPGDALAARRS